MLNISENRIINNININDYKSFRKMKKSRIKKVSLIIMLILMFLFIIFFFLPWTQNINAKGYITTFLPEQRPQFIQSVIAGRVEKWYVREGNFVEKGDTIAFLTEIKVEYMDPNLIQRTQDQVNAKSQSILNYDKKINALQNQFQAIKESLVLKKSQLKNKIIQNTNKLEMDSLDLIVLETNLKISQNQFERTKTLYDNGLKTLSELQEKELKLKELTAKVSIQNNKLSNQRNELENLNLELFLIEQEFIDKLSKTESDKQSAMSAQMETTVETSKLQNKLSSINQRQQYYYITAPQSGIITKVIKKGIGETIKEGDDLLTIMPTKYSLVVESYIKPEDMPLLSIGNHVQLRFDGWPSIVISGWPEMVIGVFKGNIVAIDQIISENGYYRVLISPDEKIKKWPKELRVGAGVNTFIMLKNVPIWYEVWRQLNGFPVDFYKKDNDEITKKVKK